MRARDRGVIVQVGSALAYRAIPLQATYCAAKHAVRGFTDALRCELMAEKSGVKVTTVHLPGLNTPQFGWVRTTLRRHPRPVPPIYQPEIAADAIVWASEHPRREFFVGGSTVLTIVGNKLAPRVADRYLARTNIQAQQTDIPIAPDRPDYLERPLPGDRGAHGIFDDSRDLVLAHVVGDEAPRQAGGRRDGRGGGVPWPWRCGADSLARPRAARSARPRSARLHELGAGCGAGARAGRGSA